MNTVGRVREIWRYPIKSMGGEQLNLCRVGLRGIPGDRRWAVCDEQAGKIRRGETLPKLMLCRARYLDEPMADEIHHLEIGLPDGTTLRSDDPRTSKRLSEFLGCHVTLWPLAATQPKVSSLSLLTTATIETLSALNPKSRFDVRRFRPNLYVETTNGSKGSVEVGWIGKVVGIGGLRVTCGRPVHRCGMTTYEQPGLLEDSLILRTIAQRADRSVGIYADPVRSGSVSVGDLISGD